MKRLLLETMRRHSSDLGVMNELGQGGSINLKQARTWFGLACKNGHKEGCERYENN